MQNLTVKCQNLSEEMKKLDSALERSRDNGERLHKESELVIANVNTWVNEQRFEFSFNRCLYTRIITNLFLKQIEITVKN